MKLSIQIPTMNKRAAMFGLLINELQRQIAERGAEDEVEILTECDDGEMPTGTKRNRLLERVQGTYQISHDCDDWPAPFYIEELLKACDSGCDCAAMTGIISTDGANECKWYISKDLQYVDGIEDGKTVYYRFPNHICLIKSSIAKQFRYPDIYSGEDFSWASAIHNSGLIQTEYKIERHPMYHYRYSTHK